MGTIRLLLFLPVALLIDGIYWIMGWPPFERKKKRLQDPPRVGHSASNPRTGSYAEVIEE